ncbi:MAG: HEAT repeat domain-containing protein [Nitrospirae bacterium]|nr:HEAT repeat domain-containing protein [Nitrospirota bacterium]
MVSRPRAGGVLASRALIAAFWVPALLIVFTNPSWSQTEEYQRRVPGPIQRPAEDTKALIQLMNPYDPLKRIQAAERLGRTGNPIYAEPLGWAMVDRNLAVRKSAARALGHLPEGDALPVLVRALSKEKDDGVLESVLDAMAGFQGSMVDWQLKHFISSALASERVRLKALDIFGTRAPPDGRVFLDLNRGSFPPAMRTKAEEIMAESYGVKPQVQVFPPVFVGPQKPEPAPVPAPTPVPAVEEPPPDPRARGRWLLVTSSGLYGASFLDLMRRASDSQVSPSWTMPIGLTVGGGTAYLMTHFSHGVSPGPALWWTSSGIWGVAASHWTANGMGEGHGSTRRLYNLAGEGIGLGAGGISAFALDWTISDTTYVNTGGVGGALWGWGLELMSGPERDPAKAGWLTLAGATGGLTLAALSTERVTLRNSNLSMLFLASGYGAWAGAWAPGLGRRSIPGHKAWGGSLTGLTTGYAAGVFLSQRVTEPPEFAWRVVGAGAMGNLLGAGLGFMFFDTFDQPSIALMEGLGIGGLATGVYYDHLFPASREQPGFKSFVFLSGAYYGALVPRALNRTPHGRRRTGRIMAGFPMLTAATLAFGNGLEIPPRGTAGLYWGEILGSVSGAGWALTSRSDQALLSALAMGGGVLGAAGGYGMSQSLSWAPMTEREHSFVMLLTASGAWYGAWAPVMLPGRVDLDRVGGGALALSPLALGTSLVLADQIELRPRINHGLFFGEAVGFLAGAGAGWSLLADRRTTTAMMLAGGAGGMFGGYVFVRNMAAASPVRAWRESILVAHGTLAGAWYGGWTARSFRLSGRRISARRVSGGALLGGTVGLTGTMWITNHYDVQNRVLPGLFYGQVMGGTFGQGVGFLMTRSTGRNPSDETLGKIDREVDRSYYIMAASSAAGMTGGYFFATRMADPSSWRGKETSWFFLHSSFAAWYGAWLPTMGRSRVADVEQRHVFGGVMTAVPTAMAASIWSANHMDLSPRTVPSLLLGGILGTSTGIGVAETTLGSGRFRRASMLTGGAAGELFGYAYGRALRAGSPNTTPMAAAVTSLGTFSGLWYGAWLPTLVARDLSDVSDRRIAGGVMVGGPAAFAVSLWTANQVGISPRSATGFFLGEGLGTSFGAGLGLLIHSDDRWRSTFMLSSGALGAWSGLEMARRMIGPSAFRDDEGAVAVALSTASFTWYGTWLPTLAVRDLKKGSPSGVIGGAMMAAPVGFAASTWIVNHHVVRERDLKGIFGGEVMGFSVGAGIGMAGLSSRRWTTSLMLGTGAVGALAGYRVAQRLPGQALEDYPPLLAFTALTGLWYGGWSPTFTARRWSDIESRRVTGGLMIGGPLGLATGLILRHRQVEPLAYTGFFMGESLGSMGGAGAAMTLDSSHRKTTAAMLASGVALGAAGSRVLPRMKLSDPQQKALGMGAFFGVSYGALLPYVVEGRRREVEGKQIAGGVMFGLPAGLVTTTAAFAFWDPAGGSVGLTWLSGIIGSAAGLGLGLTIEDWNSRAVIGSMYSTGLSGLALGARAPQIKYTSGALLFSTFGTVYGFSQGLALSIFGDFSERQAIGAMMLGSSLGLGTSLIITYDLQVGTGGAAVAYTGGIWGGFVGAMLAQVAAGGKEETTTAAVIVSNAGQLATTFSLLYLRIPPRRMGWINLFGLTGLGIGSAIGLPLSEGGDVFFITAPAGSLIGLTTGAIVTSYWDWEEERKDSGQTPSIGGASPLRETSPGHGWRSLVPRVDAVAPQFGLLPDPSGRDPEGRYTVGVMIWYH